MIYEVGGKYKRMVNGKKWFFKVVLEQVDHIFVESINTRPVEYADTGVSSCTVAFTPWEENPPLWIHKSMTDEEAEDWELVLEVI